MEIVLVVWIVNMFLWSFMGFSEWADEEPDMWVLGLFLSMFVPPAPWIIYIKTN